MRERRSDLINKPYDTTRITKKETLCATRVRSIDSNARFGCNYFPRARVYWYVCAETIPQASVNVGGVGDTRVNTKRWACVYIFRCTVFVGDELKFTSCACVQFFRVCFHFSSLFALLLFIFLFFIFLLGLPLLLICFTFSSRPLLFISLFLFYLFLVLRSPRLFLFFFKFRWFPHLEVRVSYPLCASGLTLWAWVLREVLMVPTVICDQFPCQRRKR